MYHTILGNIGDVFQHIYHYFMGILMLPWFYHDLGCDLQTLTGASAENRCAAVARRLWDTRPSWCLWAPPAWAKRWGPLPGEPGVTMDFELEHSRKTVGKPAKSGGQSILKHLETNSGGLKIWKYMVISRSSPRSFLGFLYQRWVQWCSKNTRYDIRCNIILNHDGDNWLYVW